MPMIWTEPKNHVDDCYFYVVELYTINKRKIAFPELAFAKRPRLCSDERKKVPSVYFQNALRLERLTFLLFLFFFHLN